MSYSATYDCRHMKKWYFRLHHMTREFLQKIVDWQFVFVCMGSGWISLIGAPSSLSLALLWLLPLMRATHLSSTTMYDEKLLWRLFEDWLCLFKRSATHCLNWYELLSTLSKWSLFVLPILMRNEAYHLPSLLSCLILASKTLPPLAPHVYGVWW